ARREEQEPARCRSTTERWRTHCGLPAAQADSAQSLEQCLQVHERGRGRAAGAQGGGRPRLDRACRRGQRHRYDRRTAGETVSGLHPGRLPDRAPVRRHGARPCHHAQARAHDGRRRDGEERTGQRFGVYGAPAGGREHIKAITCRTDEGIERREGRFKMKLPRRNFLHLAAGAAALQAMPRIARAQAYPSRPITMIVPLAPGGLTDVIGRVLAEGMRTSLGQPVIIENVGGANGSIGTGRVARAAPDGYTLVVGVWNTHVANSVIYPLQYDVVKDFEPIGLLADAPMLLIVNKAIPANNLSEFISWLKANPDKSSMGTAGAGSPPHLL